MNFLFQATASHRGYLSQTDPSQGVIESCWLLEEDEAVFIGCGELVLLSGPILMRKYATIFRLRLFKKEKKEKDMKLGGAGA